MSCLQPQEEGSITTTTCFKEDSIVECAESSFIWLCPNFIYKWSLISVKVVLMVKKGRKLLISALSCTCVRLDKNSLFIIWIDEKNFEKSVSISQLPLPTWPLCLMKHVTLFFAVYIPSNFMLQASFDKTSKTNNREF